MNERKISDLLIRNELLTSKAGIYIKKLRDLNPDKVIIEYKELEHTLFLIIEQMNKNLCQIQVLRGNKCE